MPTKLDNDALPVKVKSSYQKLLSAATALNSASDRFSKLVVEIDSTLKPLNIGIDSFVRMGSGWCGDFSRGHAEVGYTKIGGKWCIALREIEEFPDRDDDIEVWAFSDGPRRLRLKAIDYLPDLLESLAGKATSEAENITSKTTDLQQLVSALRECGKQ